MSFTLGLQCPHDASGICTCRTIGLGRLSIFTAAEYGLVDAVREVLSKDTTKANAEDSYGYTPLHYAAQRNHAEVIKLLLRNGAKVDGGKCGATPLHRAASANALEACRLLIAAGADVNARDTSFGDQRSPLMKAASQGSVDIVKLLMSSDKVDIYSKDCEGHTAWEIANSAEVKKLINPHVVEADAQIVSNLASSESFNGEGDKAKFVLDPIQERPQPLLNNEATVAACSLCNKPALFMKRSPSGSLVCSACFML